MMKAAFAAACVFLLFMCVACAETFYVRGGEIVFQDACPEGFEPIGEKLMLGVGEAFFVANKAAYFSSDDYDVVYINEYGEAKATGEGKTIVSVYIEDDNRKDFVVDVSSAPESVKLNRKTGKLDIGETYQLKATISKGARTTLSWYSSAPEIASVDDSGVITANKPGEAAVTVTTHNGLSAQCIVTVTMPEPARIEFFSQTGVMYEGETLPVLYKLVGGYHETVTWSSDNTDVASVNEAGEVTAHRTGEAVIRASASGGASEYYHLTVEPGSDWIRMSVNEVTIYEGGRFVPQVVVHGGRETFELVSMDESIAFIDRETNEVVAKKCGSVYIMAFTPNYGYAECLLNVVKGPDPFVFEAKDTSLAVLESLETTLNKADFEIQYTEYASSDYDVATVNEYGVITAVGEGECVVSAECGGLCAEIYLTVYPMAKDIMIMPGADELGAGDTCTTEIVYDGGYGRAVYSSSDERVASVDSDTGLITAHAPGTAEITAALSNGVSASCAVSVLPAPKHVYFEKAEAVLSAGSTHKIAYGIDEGAITTFEWTSTDPEIVFFQEGFLICPGKTGNAAITVLTHNGLTASMNVTVLPEPDGIKVNANQLHESKEFDYYVILRKGELYDLSAYVENVGDILIFYHASHPKIASVTDTGLVEALSEGTCLIEVSIASGVTERVLISVG